MKTKTEYQLKKEARLKAAGELERTKKRLGLREPQPPRGVMPDPLVATTLPRRSKPAPTSDRIPGSPFAGDLLHAHKWKRGVKLTLWPDPDGKYLIKGGSPKVWKKFHLRKDHRRLQGIIHGKRCGTTENIGPAARTRAKEQHEPRKRNVA